jgi:DNA polymerase I-like protein with 3'-5' exonuclease and polymerase domains
MESYVKFWVPVGDGGTFQLYPNLNPTGTGTLRFSSETPNEQNISKKEGYNIREAFGPGPGREWWSHDYENIELRLPGYKSGEQLLIDLFEKADEPPYYGSEHLLNFSVVYPDIWAQAVKEVGLDQAGPWLKKKYKDTWYQWCKNGDFAVGYGAGDATADTAFHRKGARKLLIERFSRKEALNQECIAFARRLGYVETWPDKTVDPDRGYPIYCSRSEYGDISPTVPLNYKVQGTAMWCTRKAMVRCHEFLNGLNHGQLFLRRRWPGGYFIHMQVHDEMDFDFPALGKENLPVVNECKRLMELSGDDVGVPLRVSVSYHPENWKDEVKI